MKAEAEVEFQMGRYGRLQEASDAQRAELEKMREQQNAAIAKVRRACAFFDTT